MRINKVFRYRIYPTKQQEITLCRWFGQSRFVYNYFLRQRIDFFIQNKDNDKKGLTYCDTSKMLTNIKKNEEFAWLNESNSQCLQQSLRHLDDAYQNFWKKKSRFPQFKKKSHKQTLHIPQHFSINTEHDIIKIPKLDPIKTVFHRPIEGTATSIIITKTPTSKYFVCIVCEIEQEVIAKPVKFEIGVDLGLKSFLVTSEGEIINSPKFLCKSERKLKRTQKRLSRRKKGSNRRDKQRIKVARIHEKITNQRKDFLHKLSHRLVSENQAIYVEDLAIKNMIKNHKLAKSISDSGWGEFLRQLKYKSEWVGTTFIQIDRFFPSSKRCVVCGWINDSLSLSDRDWICSCGAKLDRDINAAQNILMFGNLVRQDMSELTLGESRRCKATHRTEKHPNLFG